MTQVDLDTHCRIVAMRLADAKVIPFLGAGANLCDRPEGVDWLRDGYLPSGAELAEYLSEKYPHPEGERHDLVRVSQYVDLVTGGEAALYEALHPLFAGDYKPNRLHEFMAALPARLRAHGCPEPCQLLITTNYDDALERAFMAAEEPYDLVYYAAEPDEPGLFVHVRPDGRRSTIRRPTDYRGFALGERTVILKIHGAVDRRDELRDSYVITEDNYIDFLAGAGVPKLIPAQLMSRMRTSHFLFLGYGMRDWNLRIILRHIWGEQTRRLGSWAIQNDVDPIDEKFWQRHRVEIVDATLERWVEAMDEHTR